MLKKDTEGGLLRVMRLAKRAMAEKSAAKTDQAPPDSAEAPDASGQAENTIDQTSEDEKLIENLNVTPEEAGVFLLEASPDGLKGLSARTANELCRLKRENALIGEPMDYLNDVSFLTLLQELPPSLINSVSPEIYKKLQQEFEPAPKAKLPAAGGALIVTNRRE